MLKGCFPLLGEVHYIDKEPRRKKLFGDSSSSFNLSIQLKDITVRIIHAGGREERYQCAIPASQLLQRYPGMCVARPEVFKNPDESIVLSEETLLPGKKYYIIPSTTVQKLKRKHSMKKKVKEPDEGNKAMLDSEVVADVTGDWSEESVCSARDFYSSEERWSRCLRRKCQLRNQQFVPPIQKPRMWRELEWQPSLTSVQELSP